MKWSLHQLAKYRKEGLSIDETIQLDELKKRNSEIRDISPVHVKGHCTFDAAQMTCHFRLTGTLTLPCARTWEDVLYPFDIESDEIFSWADSADDEGDIHVVEGEVINPKPVFEDLILVNIPMQVFKEDAPSETDLGGKNWSFITEDEMLRAKEDEKQKLDPRLADLAKYFDQTDE